MFTSSSLEQPDAPLSENDTAPKEPKLEGKALNQPESTNDSVPSSSFLPEPSNTISNDALKSSSAVEQRSTEDVKPQVQDKIEPKTEPKSLVVGEPKPKPKSVVESENKGEAKGEGEGESESSPIPHPKADDPDSQVSEEALKGPQGPAPKPAEEFENEEKDKKPIAKDVESVQAEPSE